MATLTELDAADGPFASVVLAAPSALDDASHRLDVHLKNAHRRLVDSGFPPDDIAAIDEAVVATGHGGAEALFVCRPVGGPTLVERLNHEVGDDLVVVADLPRYGPVLENRQRSVAHVVVEADRVGAQIVSFDAGGEVTTDVVEGETLHVTRSAPGGWSQRRFQQRAENRWESNAADTADVVASAARDVDAELVVVAGDVRAVGFLTEHLPGDVSDLVHVVDEGSASGISEATVRLVDDAVARRTTSLLGEWRDRRGADRACAGVDATLRALAEGRVECLLVHDDPRDERSAEIQRGDEIVEGRMVDVAIRVARETDAEVRVIPTIADVTDGVAALLRW